MIEQDDKDKPKNVITNNFDDKESYEHYNKLYNNDNGTIRKFETGATRDTSKDKLDFEGFISPLVLRRYAQYLHKHRVQSDGTLRDSDNWQKGIPKKEYMKSKIRHGNATHLLFDGFQAYDEKGNKVDMEESLCAELFNAMGYLFELLKEKEEQCSKIT